MLGFLSRFFKPKPEKQKSDKAIAGVIDQERRYLIRVSLARDIANAIKTCNILFSNLAYVPTLFREDIQVISALYQPCDNENDFYVKLGALAGFFQVDPKPWNALFPELDPKIQRANTLIINWFDKQKIVYDQEITRVWENIQVLRNASFPFYQTDQRWIKLAKLFGQDFPINYADYYESILRMFLDSLKMLQTILNGVSARSKA